MVMPWELSILDGAHALLLQAKLAIIGDTAITGNLDVSGEIVGGTIPIENLSNVDKQSFDGLIDNGDFRLWSAGDSSAPDDWSISGVTVLKESTIIKINKYSVKSTFTGGGGLLFQDVPNFANYKGRTIIVNCWVNCSTAGIAGLRISDGVNTSYSPTHTGGGDWELIPLIFNVDASASQLTIYTRVLNTGYAYFDGVMVVEGSICPAYSPKPLTDPHTYGEMYIYNNSTAAVIETANTPIALRQISGGLQKGFIFNAGSTGAITAYFDYSGTVAGTVLVGDIAHGLATGDIITIRGSTNYNGIFEITKVNNDQFYIVDTWVADDGASDWDKGASLTAQAGASGVYTSTWQMTAAPAGACRVIYFVNLNITPQIKSGAPRELAINDEDNNSSTSLIEISEGDVLWLSVQSDSTNDITHTYGNINLERM